MGSVYYRDFILGAEYLLDGKCGFKTLKFIKVTPKGFNLIDINTNKCFFKTHLYSKIWYGKEIPKGFTEVKCVAVPTGFYFTKKETTNV